MFHIEKLIFRNNTWEQVKNYSITSSDIQDIYAELIKIDFTCQELCVKNFGTKEDLALIFYEDRDSRNILMEVYQYGTVYCGKKIIDKMPNLREFLSVLYAEQMIGGIKTFKFLLDLTDTY